jgi:hypothetical protein
MVFFSGKSYRTRTQAVAVPVMQFMTAIMREQKKVNFNEYKAWGWKIWLHRLERLVLKTIEIKANMGSKITMPI